MAVFKNRSPKFIEDCCLNLMYNGRIFYRVL